MSIHLIPRLGAAFITFIISVWMAGIGKPPIPTESYPEEFPWETLAYPPSGLSIQYPALPMFCSDRLNNIATLLHLTPHDLSDEIIKPVIPDYPELGRVEFEEGTASIEVLIGKNGEIEMACPISGPTFIRLAALDAVRHSQFAPIRSTTATRELGIVTYNFNLKDGVSLIKD